MVYIPPINNKLGPTNMASVRQADFPTNLSPRKNLQPCDKKSARVRRPLQQKEMYSKFIIVMKSGAPLLDFNLAKSIYGFCAKRLRFFGFGVRFSLRIFRLLASGFRFS